MKSAWMMRPQKDGDAVIGPFIEKTSLEAVLSEMGRLAVQAGEHLMAATSSAYRQSCKKAAGYDAHGRPLKNCCSVKVAPCNGAKTDRRGDRRPGGGHRETLGGGELEAMWTNRGGPPPGSPTRSGRLLLCAWRARHARRRPSVWREWLSTRLPAARGHR